MGTDHKAIFTMFAIAGSLLMGANAPAIAGEIYKSVDKTGKVTYAAAPRPDAVIMKKLDPPQQPTPEEVYAAEEQHQLIKTLGTELEKDRKQREEDLARTAAAERAQQNSGLIAIVYLPVPVFVSPVHHVSHINHRRPVARMHARGQL
jgi:hypothetical protein